MRTLFLFSVGAVALAGCDFSGGSDAAVTAPFASLQATGLPAENRRAPWDADGTAPDVFFEIQDVSGRSLDRSQPDPTGAATATIPAGTELPSSTMPLRIAVYDFDESLAASSLMARSAVFTADQVATASETQIAAESGPAQFTVVRR